MSTENKNQKYKGVRMRTWGKWVSEIRVPGTSERLWLGSYSNPEAAAVAHDTAVFFLRRSEGGGGSGYKYNFPERVWRFAGWTLLSPRSVQRVAGESGMEVDAELAIGGSGGGGGCAEELVMRGEWDDLTLDDFDFQL